MRFMGDLGEAENVSKRYTTGKKIKNKEFSTKRIWTALSRE
jgi:hypothetical protein